MKKVLLITYYFPPSGGAGVQRWLKTINYLPKAGVETIVLTVDPAVASYPQIDESLCNDVPSGIKIYRTHTREILSLYKKVSPKKEVPYGGFANEPNPNLIQKISRFIRGNFFLPDPRRGWNKYALAKAKEIIETEAIETIVTTSPPHSTQLIGLELKRLYPHLKWVADLRDPWTDIYYNEDLYPTRWAKKRNLRYERSVLLGADQIITVSEECKRLFAEKADVAEKIAVIPNGYDTKDFFQLGVVKELGIVNQQPEITSGESNLKTLSYIGVWAPQYDIEPLKMLVKGRNDILLRFVGVVSEDIKREIESWGVQTEFISYVSHNKAIEYMQASDALLLFIPNVPNNEGILTGKLFEYLASGRKILLFGPESGDAMSLINECEAGECFSNNFNLDSFLNMPYKGNDNIKLYSREALAYKIASLL
ncbi:MAG: glycosyltransferase family 4 protein [Paludibacteraceae bacterium]|nr:glycosyltransferase family 4 protein [Paludibacteraceae bacterium]